MMDQQSTYLLVLHAIRQKRSLQEKQQQRKQYKNNRNDWTDDKEALLCLWSFCRQGVICGSACEENWNDTDDRANRSIGGKSNENTMYSIHTNIDTGTAKKSSNNGNNMRIIARTRP